MKQYEVFDNKNQQAWKTFRKKQLQKKGKVLAEGNEPVAWFETLDLWDSPQQQMPKRSDSTTNNTNSANTSTNLSSSDVNDEHPKSCVLKCVLNQPKSGRYLLISIHISLTFTHFLILSFFLFSFSFSPYVLAILVTKILFNGFRICAYQVHTQPK